MIRILWNVLIFNLLTNNGSTYPTLKIESDSSISEDECIKSSYNSGLLSTLDISENLESMSVEMESMTNMATGLEMESVVNVESLMDVESLTNVESLMTADSLIENVQSSMYDVSAMMDFKSLINGNSAMSLMDKLQYVHEQFHFDSSKLSLISDVFGMTSGKFISHMQWKMSIIRAAREQLSLAMKALASGNMEAMASYIMTATTTMQNMCPICRALNYALEHKDYTMLSFVGNMGMALLQQVEEETDISISK